MHTTQPNPLTAAFLAVALAYVVVTESSRPIFQKWRHAITHHLSSSRLEKDVQSAFRRLEPQPRPSSGVETYHINDHTMYVTGGPATKQALNRAITSIQTFASTYGGRQYVDENSELQEVAPFPRVQDYISSEDPASEAKDYNDAVRNWTSAVHQANASIEGAVHYGIIEGTTVGTPLTLETAQRMEARASTTIADVTRRIQDYAQRETCKPQETYSRFRMPEMENRSWAEQHGSSFQPRQHQPPRRHRQLGDWLGRGPSTSPRGLSAGQYHQWKGSSY